MGNNSMCSCKNSDLNTESSIIREDQNRNEQLKKNKTESTFNSQYPNSTSTRSLKTIISNITSPQLKKIALNNYAKKITSCLREGIQKMKTNKDLKNKLKKTPNSYFNNTNNKESANEIINIENNNYNNNLNTRNPKNGDMKIKSVKQNDFETSLSSSLRQDSLLTPKQLTFQNSGFKYIGERSSSNMKEGFGIQIWNDGGKFKGFFHENRANGLGLFLHSDGDKYLGYFLNDHLHGYGIYTHNNGAEYNGEWKEESQEGIGIETWKDGSIYKGCYKNGKKEGIGQYIWSDNSKYEGEWKNNFLSGYGIYYFYDGRIYLGMWDNNMMNGLGVFCWKDGKKYIGFYKNDKKDGFGIYCWKEPRKIFIGFWSEGKQNGIGKYMDSQRVKFGIWERGKKLKWFNDENEIYEILDEDKKKYKDFFRFSFEEMCNFIAELDNETKFF